MKKYSKVSKDKVKKEDELILVHVDLDKEAFHKLKRVAKQGSRTKEEQCAFFIHKGVLPPSMRDAKSFLAQGVLPPY